MAGAIDPHTHIGGGKMTIARMLMPEDHQRRSRSRAPRSRAPAPATRCPRRMVTGYRYAEMGYTACFEPAMLPANARQAHMEMGDTPMVDKGAFVMLGSDDFFLRQLAAKKRLRARSRITSPGPCTPRKPSPSRWSIPAASAPSSSTSASSISTRSTSTTASRRAQIILTLARARAGARRHASAAHPRLQSRRPRQYRDDARHDPRRGRPAACT